jgi:hypothetical protein
VKAAARRQSRKSRTSSVPGSIERPRPPKLTGRPRPPKLTARRRKAEEKPVVAMRRVSRGLKPILRALVVPANAGTHNHRPWLSRKTSARGAQREAAAYGSLRSQGRREFCRGILRAGKTHFAHYRFHFSNRPAVHRHNFAISRRTRPSLAINIAHSESRGRRECRAPNAPAASCVKSKKHTSIVTTVTPDSPGIPRAMVLTAYIVLSPAIGLVCHRRRRNYFRRLDAGVEASGPHDFAVRVAHARLACASRPPHLTATFVTIATRPSFG